MHLLWNICWHHCNRMRCSIGVYIYIQSTTMTCSVRYLDDISAKTLIPPIILVSLNSCGTKSFTSCEKVCIQRISNLWHNLVSRQTNTNEISIDVSLIWPQFILCEGFNEMMSGKHACFLWVIVQKFSNRTEAAPWSDWSRYPFLQIYCRWIDWISSPHRIDDKLAA